MQSGKRTTELQQPKDASWGYSRPVVARLQEAANRLHLLCLGAIGVGRGRRGEEYMWNSAPPRFTSLHLLSLTSPRAKFFRQNQIYGGFTERILHIGYRETGYNCPMKAAMPPLLLSIS